MQKGFAKVFILIGILILATLSGFIFFNKITLKGKILGNPMIKVECPANEKQPTLDVKEAAKIAKETNCSAEGTLDASSASCTTSSGNWTFGFQPKENIGKCGVVCYVDSKTKIADLIWMCANGNIQSSPKDFENP